MGYPYSLVKGEQFPNHVIPSCCDLLQFISFLNGSSPSQFEKNHLRNRFGSNPMLEETLISDHIISYHITKFAVVINFPLNPTDALHVSCYLPCFIRTVPSRYCDRLFQRSLLARPNGLGGCIDKEWEYHGNTKGNMYVYTVYICI